MKEKRLSIYAGEPLTQALACLGERYDENKSGRLNTVCERYLMMVADELGRLDLSRAEWCATLDANNGVEQYTGLGAMPVMLWANIHDTPGLGEKWDIDQGALVGKLQKLPKSSLVAIQEACDRFWSRADRPTDDALVAAGITIR